MKFEICKQYLKSKICIGLSFLFFVITYGFAIFFQSLGMTGFSLLHTIVRFNYYICFFVVCITYYYISSANRNYVKEVSEAAGHQAVYEINALFFITIQMLVWNIGMCIILIFCSTNNDGTGYFISWFPINYIYNIVIPQAICVFLTFLVSASWNSSRWLMLEILFLFLISPFSEDIVWEQKPEIPVDYFWKKIRWPFQILYQNGEWSADYQNDFQIERVRIFLLLFWVFLFLCIGLAYIWKKKVISILVGICAVVFLLLSYQPASIYRLNSSWDGVNKDYTDYSIHIEDNTYRSQEASEFSVTDYDLQLSFNNELSVKGTLEIEAPIECQEFYFTLYHGYSIEEVVSETKGVEIQFEQQKDSLYIRASQKVTRLKLNISYKGHHNKFYSNSRAVMLPGWFPWYPMEGKRQVVLEYPDYGKMWGYNPYNRVETAHICIKSDYPVITNLFDKGNNVYEGEADSITVLGGNLCEIQDTTVKNYLPLELHSEYGLEEFMNKQKQNYYDSLEKLKCVYGIDVSEFENKVIIFASKDIGRNVTNNFLAVFDDYILATPDYVTANDLLHYIVLRDYENRDKREQSELIQIFINSFFDDDSVSIIASWMDEVKMRQEHPEYYSNELNDPQLFMEVLEKIDSEILIKEAVQYMLYPEKYGSDREFLEAMRAML